LTMRLLLGLVLLLAVSAPLLAQAPKPLAVCSVGQFLPWIGDRRVDPELKQRLNADGVQIGSLTYAEVTEAALKPFEVVVVQWAPNSPDAAGMAVLRKAVPVLRGFVEQGGGLLVTCEEGGVSASSPGAGQVAIDELLAPFGSHLVKSESVVDPANSFQQKRYLQWWFARTSNITHPHPVTEGIDHFIYPLGYSPTRGPHTRSMTFDKAEEWTVLLRGEKTAATSEGTYKSEPPLLAVRSFGKGRMAALPMHTTYFLNAGYHRVWESIALGEGPATDMPQGQGLALLKNLLRWLGEPGAAAGLGGYQEGPTPKPPVSAEALAALDPYTRLATYGREPVTEITRSVPPEKNDYIGVLGCYTSYSCPQPNYVNYGQGSVDEYCAVARKYGLAFLVFTDRLEFMDEAAWGKLVADCQRNTDDQFIAMPGIEYEDGWGNRRMAFNLPRWPAAEWLSTDGRRVINAPGFYFGEDWAPNYLRAPKLNFHAPWNDKFYSGMELFSYERDRLVSSDYDAYAAAQRDDYNLIPMVGHRVHSPNDLEMIARAAPTGRMMLTHVRADQVSDIPGAFKYAWYAQRHTYVSNGPRITDFYVENGRAGLREEPWRLYLGVESDQPLARVALYDGTTKVREWLVAGKSFHAELTGYHDRRHSFRLRVSGVGGQAESSTAYVSDVRQGTYMCTDLQNTINSMTDIDPFTGKLTYYNVMGNFVTGWDNGLMGILAEESQIMPPGLDYTVKGFTFATSHRIFGGQDVPEETAVARREMPFECGDVNMLDNIYENTLRPGTFFAPTTVAKSRARYICPTPEPYGINLMLIEQEVTFLWDVTFGPAEKPNLTGLYLGMPANVFKSYALIAPDGSGPKGDRPEKLAGTVPAGGYLAFYPEFYGNYAVFPLDGPAAFLVQGKLGSGGEAYLGVSLAGQTIKAGEQRRFRWLLARGRFGEEGIADFEQVRRSLGLSGPPSYRATITRGKLESTKYVCQISADDYAVAGELGKADLPVPLPVRIGPLNGKWDAGLVDLSGPEPKLRRVGVEEVWGWFELDPRRGPVKFAAGNLLTCEDREVWLSLLQEEGAWYAEVHRPATEGGQEPREVAVRVPEWVKVVPAQEVKVTVAEGTTEMVRLQG